MRCGTDSSMVWSLAVSVLRLRVSSKWHHEPFRARVRPSTNMAELDIDILGGQRLDRHLRARKTLISQIAAYVQQHNQSEAQSERIFNTEKVCTMLAPTYPERAKESCSLWGLSRRLPANMSPATTRSRARGTCRSGNSRTIARCVLASTELQRSAAKFMSVAGNVFIPRWMIVAEGRAISASVVGPLGLRFVRSGMICQAPQW